MYNVYKCEKNKVDNFGRLLTSLTQSNDCYYRAMLHTVEF